MRGIRKPWPPADVSPDGQATRSMRQAAMDFQASLAGATNQPEHARACFDALDKGKLRAVLYREQRYVCIYCERQLGEETETPPIEHWRALNKAPQDALSWENLYLSCPTRDTCDGAKGGEWLAWESADAPLPWPTEVVYESWFGFTSGGEMYVRSEAPLTPGQLRALELAVTNRDDEGQRRRSILNLNHSALIEARKAVIDSERSRIEREYPDRRAPEVARRARAASLLQEVRYPAFVSVRVAWLERALGKGRPREPSSPPGNY